MAKFNAELLPRHRERARMLSAKKHNQAKKEALEWLIRLQSPGLSQEDETCFFAWLEEAPEHQFAYVQAEKLWERSGNTNELRGLLRDKTPSRNIFFIPWAYASFAGAALALFLVVFLLPRISPSEIKTTDYVTAIGEQRLITLEDGSTAFLNTNSHISVTYSKKNRSVSLNAGEAFFKVNHDAKRPFLVPLESGVVRVLGTAFSVRKDSKDAVVTVLEGKVALIEATQDLTDNFSAPATATLTAGEQLSFSDASQNIKAKKVDAKSVLNWRAGQLVFRGESLRSVVNELNRYSEHPILIASKELESQRVVAVIQVNNIDNAIETLEVSLDIQSTRLGDGTIELLPNNTSQ